MFLGFVGVGMSDSFVNPMVELTGFKRDLLFGLAWFESEGEMDLDGFVFGQSLCDLIEEQYGSEVHNGRLYPNLSDLKQDGLVEHSQPHGYNDDLYRLTDRGREVVEEYYGARSFVEGL